jgi:RNA polymerase sigma-70 factor (ECF subfamily)
METLVDLVQAPDTLDHRVGDRAAGCENIEPAGAAERLKDRSGNESGNERVFALLQRMGRGDEAALRELYRAYSRSIYAFALRRLRDAAEAEEIVVDTMHEVWRHPERFRGESKFSTWLLGIARFKLLSLIRAREPQHEEIGELEETLESGEEGVFEILAQKQRREAVRQCMDKLPPEQRECLHLVFYEGYGVAEVAEVLGCPENTVKTRLFHARRKLKNALRLMLQRENGNG